MDLYQMIATHSRPWSEREFLFFGSVILVCTLCLLAAVAMHKIKKTQALGAIIALVYMVIIFGSTVFTRGVSSRQCELTVLWSWKEVLAARDREMMTEILLNCVMLMPIGILLPMAAGRRIHPAVALLAGAVLSGTIEVSQFIFARGLFEWDDIIHNSLGCMLGCVVANGVYKFLLKERRCRNASGKKPLY